MWGPKLRASYFARHWRGELSLPVAFWVNGILGNLVVTAASVLLFRLLGDDFEPVRILLALCASWAIVFCVFVWQIVGVWNAADRHRSRGGRTRWAVAAKVTALLAIVLFAFKLVDNAAPQIHETYRMANGDPTVGSFEIRLLAGGRELEFRGGIPFGATEAVREALETAPRVYVIHLNSHGGRLGEARRLRDLIRQHGFDTYTATECASACTIAFIGGVQRFINPEAKLAFHAGSFPGLTAHDLRSENERQRQEFVRFGVSAAFAERTVTTPSEDLWIPDTAELLDSGFVSAVSHGQFAISGWGSDPTREEIRDKVRQVSSFDAVAEADPDAFERIVDALAEGVAKGMQEAVVHARMREPLGELVERFTPTASDEALITLAKVVVEELEIVGRASAEHCYTMMFPGSGPALDARLYFSAELQKRDAEASEAIIRTGSVGTPPPVSDEEFDRLLKSVMLSIQEKYGEGAVDKLALIGTPNISKADTCTAAQILHREVLELPAADAAKVLRRLLASG